ncbi:O-antigen ligase family protein [Providencia sp. PROV174]|uniref:O-antigen ligase family protein n=1 Tax=Providencia sp. PROV174 TaxID=2949877 RepID=UPI00234A6074|nr:O-antigen ligase family protein [Providencia sp. PROV174]
MNKLIQSLCFFSFFSAIILYDIKSFPFYIFWGASLSLCIAYLIKAFINHKIKKSTLYVLILNTVWILWSLLNFPIIKDFNDFISFTIVTIFYSLSCAIICEYTFNSDARLIYKYVKIASVSFVLVSFLSLINYISNNDRSDFSGLFSNRNTFAITAIFLIIALITSYKSAVGEYLLPRKDKITLYFLLFSLSILILLTKSMKGFLSLFIIYAILNIRLTPKMILVSIFFIFTFIFIAFIHQNPLSERIYTFIYSVTTPSELNISESSYIRMNLILDGLNIINEHPIIGVGINQSRYYLFPEYYILLFERGVKPILSGEYSHNNYIEIALNGGIPALILYYFPIIYSLYYLIKKKNKASSFTIRVCILLIFLKFFYDYGMVSYKEFFNILSISFVFAYIIKLKNENVKCTRKNI